MNMFAVTEQGELMKITMSRSEASASKVLAGIAPPIPMHIGRIKKNVSMFVLENEERTLIFNLPELKISTNFLIHTDESGNSFIYPSWGIGLKARITWTPPAGFKLLLVLRIKGGHCSQQLIVVNRNNNQYVAPIKNVFSDGFICTGVDTEFNSHTNGYRNVEKICDAPTFLQSTNWNSDAGCLTDDDYKVVYRCNLNGQFEGVDPAAFQRILSDRCSNLSLPLDSDTLHNAMMDFDYE